MGAVRRRGRVVRVDLTEAEIAMLASLVTQVQQVLADGLPDAASADAADPLQAIVGVGSTDATTPDNPVLLRLLPDAYRDDDDAAAEYRRLMDGELRMQKTAALQRVLDDLAGAAAHKNDVRRAELSDEAAAQWLYAVNDVRLSLGTTLDVTEETYAELGSLDPESPRAAALAVYDWLTWLQDAMVRAVSG
jgi:hypothetical protein